MTREQAYERLELPAGTDLQQVRRKFQQMHNDFQMRIDNAPTPKLRQAFERGMEEIKQAYALLNESACADDSASLPRMERTFVPSEEEASRATPPISPERQASSPSTTTDKKRKAPIGLGAAAALLLAAMALYFFASRTPNPGEDVRQEARADSAAWEAAKAGGNEKAYAYYIASFPVGIFRQAATDSLAAVKTVQAVAAAPAKKAEAKKEERATDSKKEPDDRPSKTTTDKTSGRPKLDMSGFGK